MLGTITHTTNFLAMVISLWMAFYLFARGFPNRVTARAALSLFAIAIFFLGTYNHFFYHQPETSNLRASLLVIALSCWYGTTFAILPYEKRKSLRWMNLTILCLSCASVLLLVFSQSGGMKGEDDLLYTNQLNGSFLSILYAITQLTTSAGVLFNLSVQRRFRSTSEGKYFLLASLFLVLALGYGVLAITTSVSMPRVIEDGLVFSGIFLLGISVARYQSLVERRTIWQDFTVSAMGMAGIVAIYVLVCLWVGVPTRLLGNIAAAVIISHSIYDLGREAVERWRIREENRLRRKIHQSVNLTDEALQSFLNEELKILLTTIHASCGLIAIRRNENLTVAASYDSLPLNSDIPSFFSSSEGIVRVEEKIRGLVWISQAFEGINVIALVGIGSPNKKMEYSTGSMELLEEFTDQIGTLVSISNSQKNAIQPAVYRVAESLSIPPEADWVKMVEEGLRRYSDYVSLGQSPLAEQVGLNGGLHIERGKQIQRILLEAIQSLRPEGERPSEPLPREWYNHVVLHDAYVKGVPNREVMARLFVSEGTFHRIRRHAVRGVARYLAERKKQVQ